MEDLTVHVETKIRPTESEEKVRQAVVNIFPTVEATIQGINREAVFKAEGRGVEVLAKFCEILRRERIRAAARAALVEGIDRHSVTFYLNKQVAYVGHVSFAHETAESPLGPIRVRIDTENPRELVNWLTSNVR